MLALSRRLGQQKAGVGAWVDDSEEERERERERGKKKEGKGRGWDWTEERESQWVEKGNKKTNIYIYIYYLIGGSNKI